MDVILFQTPGEFLSASRPFLERHPAAHQLILADVLGLPASERRDDVLMTAVFCGGSPILAAMMMSPHALVLSHADVEPAQLQEATELMAQRLAQYRLPGVMGSPEPANVFSATYCANRGIRYSLEHELGIHQLTKVIPPEKCPGSFRRAVEGDANLLTDFREGFQADVKRPATRNEVLESVYKEIASGSLFLWEHERPVSTAASKRPLGEGIAVGAVYTPPEFRHRGYASACVAALSQFLLDSGYAYCSLYTDLANPTSTHIYRAIGYEPIGEVAVMKFDSPTAM